MKKIMYLIIVLATLASCGNNQSTHDDYLEVTIDSISKHQRYTTLPFYYYQYHTNMGTIPSNALEHKTGDKITIKVIKNVK